ncbi:MAG: hypothetical protein HY074_03715 [Deltaproteobacteria bacterium]|nr:hypothetical protein [Deltaproteobacteria bacterium]
MSGTKREAPKAEKRAPKKRSGTGRFIFLQLVNVFTFVAAGAVVVILHEKYQRSESRARAAEVAHYELKRMTDTFNYRLNELREEMFHLYGEQSNLARALNESERERLILRSLCGRVFERRRYRNPVWSGGRISHLVRFSVLQVV